MTIADRGFRSAADRWLVALAMAVLALILEWLVVRSVRRAAKTGAAGPARG